MLQHEHNKKSLDDVIEQILYDEHLMKDINHKFTAYNFCGNGCGELKIMYDGTLVNCQNSIFDTQDAFLLKNDNIENMIKHSMATHTYYINLLTASDDEINKYFYIFNTIHKNSFMSNLSSVITLMQYLVRTS
jgi:hypothetical protein